MAFFQYFRGMQQTRLWLVGALVALLVGLLVAFVNVAQSQVQRAAERDAMERSAAAARWGTDATPTRDHALLADGVMTVGYAPVR
ncbi:hypothetical protein [Variovorax ginsengisoli]|uniref:Uncharacterized protein n=1 Tax=Variovorax ginsengisoli TaxID=363844 RepID=A0ABT9S656_9BURK|nr:hypothetical protein [Variovorax ginsengisoli]MDP9899845.1 hypothetical protein [Variovorax ginsengisoli]